MYRIRYAPRLVVDARGDEAPIRRAEIKRDTFARYDSLDHAYRQAVSDVYHGRIVLGIEDEKDDRVVVDAIVLHVEAEKAREEIRLMVADGYGEKGSRQRVMRGLKR